MFKIRCFKAGKGDSFLLSWGSSLEHNMLIDAGVEGTYRFIAQSLSRIEKLKSILITHVDYDHVGGFFKLLGDTTYELPADLKIFMNTPDLLLYPDQSNLVKVEHGVELEAVLRQKGFNTIPLYLGLNKNNIFNIDGLELKLLSPPRAAIDQLIAEWTANELYQQYKETSSDDMVSTTGNQMQSADQIIANPPKPKQWEKDLLNSTSIAFIACYEGKSIVFLGDANPDLVCSELEEKGHKYPASPLSVDLIKISHHGSMHNTTKDLLQRFNCRNYLFSTDSSGPYWHPSRETLIMISEYGRTDKKIPLNIYSNYKLNLSNKLLPEDLVDLNMKFLDIEELNFTEDVSLSHT